MKKTDDAAYDYVLKDVKSVIQEIKFIEEKINLSLLKDAFGLSSPANYAKMAINTSPDENKNCSRDKRQNIRFKRQNKNMSETEKKNADETLNIIQKILDYNKDAQKHFQLASKVDKEKSKPKPE